MRSNLKNMGIWVLLITLFVIIYAVYSKTENVQELPITVFFEKVKSKEISRVSIKENIYIGHLGHAPRELGGAPKETTVRSIGPIADAGILQKLADENVEVRFEKDEQGGLWLSLLFQWIPILLVIGLFIFFMRQLQGSSGKAMSFGKSKAKLLSESHNKLTFADVAGIEESKEELEEIIAFLKDPKKFTKLGGRIPKGVLMMGPPGTGKTLLAKAVAGEAGVPFFSISGSDFVEMFVGVGASRVRDLFEQGKKNAPCIIFIDEIDAVGRHRGAGLGGGHDEREQTLNQLLVEMDGFESSDGVILMAATNRPDVLDPALQRPGRFDRRVVVPRPDLRGRVGILKVHTRRTPLAPDVDLEVIARGTPGMTGADLENLVNEAALFAARRNKERLELADFEMAKDKVFMGPERKSMIMTEKEKQNTAVHEAGHALVGKLLPGCDPVHKVTIIPRGQALGITWSLPTEDQLNRYRRQLKDELSMLLGGRVAEELMFDEMSAGAANDIERATHIARAMVCRWGMSDRLGPLSYASREGEVFLGRDFSSRPDHSDETAKNIDEEIRAIVVEAYGRAKALLSENLELLKRISDALVEYETLDAEDLEVLMQGGQLTREKPPPKLTAPPSPPTEEKKNRNILDNIDGLNMEPEKA